MKRKRRKRRPKPNQDSKRADQVTIYGETLDPANPSETQVQPENSASYVELQGEIEDFASKAEALREPESLPGPVALSPASEPLVSVSPVPIGADRRTHARYSFAAVAEVAAVGSGERTDARVRDLSEQGCYADTDNPLALGTDTEVRITKGPKSLQAQARVVYNQPGKGMGLMFTALQPEHRQTLDSWIAESRETSWLAANRRRSQRVLMKIPVRVSFHAGAVSLSEEETHTLAVSAHGALIAVAASLYRGQRLTLSNTQTRGSLECVVAHIDHFPGEQIKVGVEFLLPNPTFWRVAFPPKDWTPRHPHAKSWLQT